MPTMKIIELNDGTPTPFDGKYVLEYDPKRTGEDPDGNPMLCHLVCVDDPADALTLSADDLIKLWRQSNGIRPDGRANRPLSAFTVEIS